MTTVPIIFRTDDYARWGPGAGHDLIEGDVDRNFWELRAALEDFIRNPPQAKTIALFEFSRTGGMTITMSDGSTFGPFTLPVVSWRWRGEWTPSTAYLTFDVVSVIYTGVYLVLLDHTSGLVFDALARDAGDSALYGQLLALQRPPLQVSVGSRAALGIDRINFLGATVTDLGDGAVDVHVDVGLPVGEDVATATVTLASSDILAAFVTPFVVVPAPGSGKAIMLLNSFYTYRFITSPYSGGAYSGLFYDGSSGFQADASIDTMLSESSDQGQTPGPAVSFGYNSLANYENTAIVFSAISGAFTGGHGTLKITVAYVVVDV